MARVTKDKCLEIINTFEPSKEGRRKGQLGIDGKSFVCLYVRLSICGCDFVLHFYLSRCNSNLVEKDVFDTAIIGVALQL